MFNLLLLSVVGCQEPTVEVLEFVDTSAADSARDSVPPEEEVELCTQDEFCDAMLECFSFMGEELCGRYFENGMGMCSSADEDLLEEFHTCMCGCWTSEEDRSCMGMGSCSDWCTTRICMAG